MKKSVKATIETIKHMVPAVGIAIIAGAVSFTALYISPVPMVQDFGKMLKIGVIVSFLVSILILVPLLFIRDKYFTEEPKVRPKVKEPGMLESFLMKMTKGVLKNSLFIIFIAFSLTAFGFWGDTKVGVQTDIETFMPQGTKELQDIHKLRDLLGTTDQVAVMYTGNVLEKENLVWIEETTKEIQKEFPDVVVETKSVTTVAQQSSDKELKTEEKIELIKGLPKDQLRMLVTDDYSSGVILVGIKHLEAEEMKSFIDELNSFLEEKGSGELTTTVTGKSVLDVEMLSALTNGRYEMTFLGVGLVFVVLMLVYRHPVKALIAVLPIGFIVGWSGGVMYLLGLNYTPLTATLGALVIGIGTEFTVLLMERFYEERKKGIEAQEAIITATGKIGKAVLASGLTVIGGFSALVISDFVILQDFGLMTVINMTLALVSTLVVLPPVLVFLDRFVKTRKSGEKDLKRVAETA